MPASLTVQRVETLIVGAGISGLATAAFLGDREYLVLESEGEIGGYCRTVKKDGFVFDYSGHFFHFRHPELETYLRQRMGGQRVHTVQRCAQIEYGGRRIDYPFQKNLHQLPTAELIECLHDLYFAERERSGAQVEASFKDMLYARLGRGIAEKFLIPYNEKLYATDLSTLDVDAMGRFFPHASLADILRHMRAPSPEGYNATFTYPEGGAIEYVRALATEVRPEAIALREPLVELDLSRKVARTPKREIAFERVVSSAPLPRLLKLARVPHDERVFDWNKVLVFNLGFDRKGERGVHWIYYPDPKVSFYRVGFYDNILGTDRLSLYVELGLPADAKVDVAALRARVLADLRAQRLIDGHQLVAEHAALMDPAYVHITRRSMAAHAQLAAELERQGVHSIGRYGGWTYCSIEDNLVEARALAQRLRVAG